jgi:imidazolonepropionase-like amidohydrolase
MIGLLAGLAHAGQTVVFVGATVHPVSGPPVADAVLTVEDGRFTSLRSGPAGPTPAGAEVVDLAGKHVIPGIVDTHSHVGGGRLHEGLAPVQPGISAVDAIDPSHISVARARAGGLTTINVMPGSGKLMGGQTVYLKLRESNVVDDLLLCPHEGSGADDGAEDAAADDRPRRRAVVCGGMKMANGTNPQGEGGDPRSRMGSAFLQRKAFAEVKPLHDQLVAWDAADAQGWSDKKKRRKGLTYPDIAPRQEALFQILDGSRTVHFHTHRVDDIVTVLRLQEEFGFRVVLQHVSEAWKVPDLLGERQAMVSLILVDSPGGKEEALELYPSNAAKMEAAGALVALHTDDPITDSRLFLRMAGIAVRGGMSEEGALAALTLNPAKMMELDDRVGSIEPGKDADLVVLSGPPLSTWTQVEQTWIEGEKVFDRARPADHALAVGGDAAPTQTPSEAP